MSNDAIKFVQDVTSLAKKFQDTYHLKPNELRFTPHHLDVLKTLSEDNRQLIASEFQHDPKVKVHYTVEIIVALTMSNTDL